MPGAVRGRRDLSPGLSRNIGSGAVIKNPTATQTITLADGTSFIVADDAGTAVLTVTDGGAGADTVLDSVGLQLYATTVLSTSSPVMNFLTAGNVPNNVIFWDGTNFIVYDPFHGKNVIYENAQGVVIDQSLNISKTISTYDGISTAGLGFSAIYGATKQKSESATDASVLSYTPPATAGVYEDCFNLDCSASAAGVVAAKRTWKDSNGNLQSAVAQTLYKVAPSGTVAGSQGPTLAANDVWETGVGQFSIDNSATAIVWGFTLTSGTTTVKASATIKQVQ